MSRPTFPRAAAQHWAYAAHWANNTRVRSWASVLWLMPRVYNIIIGKQRVMEGRNKNIKANWISILFSLPQLQVGQGNCIKVGPDQVQVQSHGQGSDHWPICHNQSHSRFSFIGQNKVLQIPLIGLNLQSFIMMLHRHFKSLIITILKDEGYKWGGIFQKF